MNSEMLSNETLEYDPGNIVENLFSQYSRSLWRSRGTYRAFPWSNYTDEDGSDFDAQLIPAQDVSVDAVLSSLFFNSLVFVVLMAGYEVMRRLLPAVYSSKQRLYHTMGGHILHPNGEEIVIPSTHQQSSSSTSRNRRGRDRTNVPLVVEAPGSTPQTEAIPAGASEPASAEGDDSDSCSQDSLSRTDSLPDVRPFGWIGPVFGISWASVRKKAGLDGYFFLRYIRMCVRITAVTSFWAFAVLVPIYATGIHQNDAQGWYHISAANIKINSWRMWVPCIFAYFFTGFIFFVMKQEYRHFLRLRMEFLARGDAHVNPQHHYSLMVENVPYELRSDTALFDYFDKLFPGKVFSASVVLNLPDMEALAARCLRVCRRLEKSIAFYKATNRRPTHIVGACRVSLMGIQLATFNWFYCCNHSPVVYCDENMVERPKKGTRVDSISYYTQDLAACNRALRKMQELKTHVAETGNASLHASHWLAKVIEAASEAAEKIMDDSNEVNGLHSPSDNMTEHYIPQAELMTSWYGSIGDPMPAAKDIRPKPNWTKRKIENIENDINSKKQSLVQEDHLQDNSTQCSCPGDYLHEDQRTKLRRVAARLGLDFVIAGIRFFNRQLDVAYEEVVGATMSSTGFVTFLDLTSVTCAASTPLTNKPRTLEVSVAPNPQEIKWENAHVSKKTLERREQITNVVLFLGVILWSFPLAAIQAFAKAEFVAQIPGMEWILTYQSGTLTHFVNGYLPVLALLVLILILPVIFEYVAVSYERRKTFSDIQTSMLGRYFYYQLANVYITVSAGSLWKSLADILDHPSNVLLLIGESLPTMVGYFVALLLTKILAGLPMIFLRFGALARMLFLCAFSTEDKLTQRELDSIYRPENVQYGWEFPSQLLVIVIVFTYAIICPVILPVGLLYFLGSLIVYKKQVLYVYTPIYESGGAMFPAAIQRTIFGLVCGQMTLLGYTIIRGCYYIPVFLLPLPILTIWVMGYFRRHYADPSRLLSMERAREFDRISKVRHSVHANRAYNISESKPMNLDRAKKQLHTLQGKKAESQSSNLMDIDENACILRESPENASNADDHLNPSSPAILQDYGIEDRKIRFDKNAYRQPVLSKGAMEPLMYRRGQDDSLTKEVRGLLKRLDQLSDAVAESPSAASDDSHHIFV